MIFLFLSNCADVTEGLVESRVNFVHSIALPSTTGNTGLEFVSLTRVDSNVTKVEDAALKRLFELLILNISLTPIFTIMSNPF
jgi:hypothetical protein